MRKNKFFFYNFKPYIFLKKFNKTNNFFYFSNYNKIIKIKLFSGVFKNNFNIGDLIFFKNKKNFNLYKKYFYKNKFNYKNIDTTKKFSLIFSKNRFFLNLFLNKKIYKNKKLKIINKYFLHKNKKQIINYFTFNLGNVLIMSNFCVNNQDSIYFIKNKFVYLNKKITTRNKITKKNDIINLNFNKSFFIFYKNNQKKYINFFSKMLKKKKLFQKKKFYFKKKFYKINKLWTNKISNDVNLLKFLEIDFFTMSIIIIRKFNTFYNLNNFNINYFNLYLIRNYFWKLVS